MKRIPVYKFYKHKYGDELLVDVIDFAPMLTDIRRTPVFSMTFYNIMLVLEGSDVVAVNGRLSCVHVCNKNVGVRKIICLSLRYSIKPTKNLLPYD